MRRCFRRARPPAGQLNLPNSQELAPCQKRKTSGKKRNSDATTEDMTEESEKSSSKSIEFCSGIIEGHVDMDFDDMKYLVARKSIYSFAFFNTDVDDVEIEDFEHTAVSSRSNWKTSEVHMSTDKLDGSEIIAPSAQSNHSVYCYVSARFGSRRDWLASMGHTRGLNADGELVYECSSAASAEAAEAEPTNSSVSLKFSFQPDVPESGTSTLRVL